VVGLGPQRGFQIPLWGETPEGGFVKRNESSPAAEFSLGRVVGLGTRRGSQILLREVTPGVGCVQPNKSPPAEELNVPRRQVQLAAESINQIRVTLPLRFVGDTTTQSLPVRQLTAAGGLLSIDAFAESTDVGR
jgi:hypothetical protein